MKQDINDVIPGKMKSNGKRKPKSGYISKAALSEALSGHLRKCGFSKNGKGYYIKGELTKEKIRNLYGESRRNRLEREQAFLQRSIWDLLPFFADGSEVIPELIRPEIEVVESDTIESDLFRLATMCWSVPVSQGFGRRMRFLVRDASNRKLIGVFTIDDPVFNLSARDSFVGWISNDRK